MRFYMAYNFTDCTQLCSAWEAYILLVSQEHSVVLCNTNVYYHVVNSPPPASELRWTQSTPSNTITLSATLILSSHLYLVSPSGFCPSGSFTKNPAHISVIFIPASIPKHFIPIFWSRWYHLVGSGIREAVYHAFSSLLLRCPSRAKLYSATDYIPQPWLILCFTF